MDWVVVFLSGFEDMGMWLCWDKGYISLRFCIRISNITHGNKTEPWSRSNSAIKIKSCWRRSFEIELDDRSLIMAEPILSILTGLAPIHLEGAEIYDPSLPQYPNFVYWTYVVSRKPMGRRWNQVYQRKIHRIPESASGLDR